MNGVRTPAAETVPRPGFAEELLLRLAQDVRPRGNGAAAKVAAGALGGATVALLLASRRWTRR